MCAKILFSLFFCIISASSCFNLFSSFEPSNPQYISNVDTLISMGDSELQNDKDTNNYMKAYRAYRRAVELSPTNSLAIQGMCTAYLYMKIPFTNFILAIMNKDLSKIPGGLPVLFDVSRFISTNLKKIVFGSGDQILTPNDINININFFIFNSFYSLLDFIDINENSQFLNDPDDLFTLTSINLNKPGITNNFWKLSNNFIETVILAGKISPKTVIFMDSLNKSELVISNTLLSVHTKVVKGSLSNISAVITDLKFLISQQLSNINFLEGSYSNLSFTNMLSLIGYTNSSLLDPSFLITNFLASSGISNFSQISQTFSNKNYNITNSVQFTTFLTNIFKDLGIDSINDAVTNYLQI